MKHYETHGMLIQEILDDRYNKNRDLVHRMSPTTFSSFLKLRTTSRKTGRILSGIDDRPCQEICQSYKNGMSMHITRI